MDRYKPEQLQQATEATKNDFLNKVDILTERQEVSEDEDAERFVREREAKAKESGEEFTSEDREVLEAAAREEYQAERSSVYALDDGRRIRVSYVTAVGKEELEADGVIASVIMSEPMDERKKRVRSYRFRKNGVVDQKSSIIDLGKSPRKVGKMERTVEEMQQRIEELEAIIEKEKEARELGMSLVSESELREVNQVLDEVIAQQREEK